MKIKNRKLETKKHKFQPFQRFFSKTKDFFASCYYETCNKFIYFHQTLIKLNFISNTPSESPQFINFRNSYFSKNQKKFFYSNFFLGSLQTIIDIIQLLSQNNESELSLLILLLNIALTIISCLIQYKISNKILIFIFANFVRVIFDIALRYPSYVETVDGSLNSYTMFYLNQNIIMILLVNSQIISNVYLKKFSWLLMQFIIMILITVSLNGFSFYILNSFIYIYIHLMLANILINFEGGVYKEVYEYKSEAGQEKIEIEEILNIISNGVLIIDFNLSQVLFGNKKLFEMFELDFQIHKQNIKGLLEIFSKQISKITERIFIGKDEKINKNSNNRIFGLDKSTDIVKEENKEKDYYLNTFSKFQDLFINLRENFDYMHKRNLSQNLSAKRFQKHLQLIIKPTFYKKTKAFFLIFNQEFEEEDFLKDSKSKEKTKGTYYDNHISLNFLMDIIYKLKIPLSMIISGLNIIIDKKKENNENILNSMICALNYQEIFLHNILELCVYPSENIMFNPKKINFKRLFQEISENFNYFAELKDISITQIIDEKLPPDFKSDEFKLKQILYILLDNALKFSPNGGVIKLIALWKPLKKKVKFSISDTGIGISIEELSKMRKILANPDFKQYLERNSKDTIKTGLFLCQNYVLLLNKTEPFGLRIKTKEKESSVFSFYIDIEDYPEKISTDDQEIQINIKPLAAPYISRNETGLVININKTIKICDYNLSEDYMKRMVKYKEKSENLKKNVDFSQKLDESNYNHQIENSPHLGNEMKKYSLESGFLDKFEKFPHQMIDNKEIIHEESAELFEEKEQIICEDVLIINLSYFHLVALENLLEVNLLKYVKYFQIATALKVLIAKTQKNSINNLYKAILLELGLNLKENLSNLKILKKTFNSKKMPYIPIIGYSAIENKEAREILIDNGLSDVIYLPIADQEFQERILPWIVR